MSVSIVYARFRTGLGEQPANSPTISYSNVPVFFLEEHFEDRTKRSVMTPSFFITGVPTHLSMTA